MHQFEAFTCVLFDQSSIHDVAYHGVCTASQQQNIDVNE